MFCSHIVFPNSNIEKRAVAYASGQLRGHIALAGPPGVGKTTLAKCIISSSLIDPESKHHVPETNGGEWNSDSIKHIHGCISMVKTLYLEPFPYVLIDEFDLLPDKGKHAVRAAMDSSNGKFGFVFTTNHLHNINGALQSRCDVFEFESAPIEQLLQIGKKMLHDTNVELSNSDLHSLAKTCGGDIRRLQRSIKQVIVQRNAA